MNWNESGFIPVQANEPLILSNPAVISNHQISPKGKKTNFDGDWTLLVYKSIKIS